VGWALGINESGTSFANFTAGSGTWASDGTTINQTDTAESFRMARHNTKLGLGYGAVVEVEVYFSAAGQGGGGFNYAAILLGTDGSTNGAAAVILDRANGLMRWQLFGATDIRTVATTVAADTWYTLRAVANGNRITGYKDGTLIGTTLVAATNPTAIDYVGLGTYASTVKFRNFKAWTLTTGAP
jgi:hypothetical protein